MGVQDKGEVDLIRHAYVLTSTRRQGLGTQLLQHLEDNHGWIDDIEERDVAIKYGPTQEEETDVRVSRDIPILKMSLADMSLIKLGVHIFAGAQKNGDGDYDAVFIFAGEDGIVPPL